ncbi:MAG: hypothetical protein IPK42_11270 [Betaproteobacteria bacterium]|nr:hypothetical protein [Betaproteobacteria bacterium]
MATTLKLSGYLASEAAIVFSGTQQLVSLADNEYTDLSDEIDNGTNLYEMVDLRIVIASAAFITPADCGMEIYLIPTVDGTNYPTWTGEHDDRSGSQQSVLRRLCAVHGNDCCTGWHVAWHLAAQRQIQVGRAEPRQRRICFVGQYDLLAPA